MERGIRAFPAIGDGDSKENCTSQRAEIAKGMGWQDLITSGSLSWNVSHLAVELFSLHTHGCASCIPQLASHIPPPASPIPPTLSHHLHTHSDGYELGLLGFASLMEFIWSGKGGQGSARLLLDPHDPELPFLPGSRGSDNQHTACCREHPTFHIPSPIPMSCSPVLISYLSCPLSHIQHSPSLLPVPYIPHPMSCILISCILNPSSHIQCPVSSHLTSQILHPTPSIHLLHPIS